MKITLMMMNWLMTILKCKPYPMDRVFIYVLGKEIFEVVFDEEIFLVENTVM